MASDQESIDWTQLNLSADLQLLDFHPWIVITRQSLDFDTKYNKPFISMMVFLNTQSRAFILSVLYRTYKEGPIQNLEQVTQLVNKFFANQYPCFGYESDEDLPRPYSHQFAIKCTVLVAKEGDQCHSCCEKYLSIKNNDESGTSMDSILEDLVENALDSKPLFEMGDRSSDLGNYGEEIVVDEPYDGSEYFQIVENSENDVDSSDTFDAFEKKPDQEDQETVNANQTSIPCTLCNKSYKSSYSLRTHHRRSHQCGQVDQLNRGKLLEYQRNVQCSLCDAQFLLGKQLFPHLKTIHQMSDKEITQRFHVPKCWICHRAFATLSIQTMHKKRDHLLGKWQCSVCLEVLKHGQELHDHYETKHKPDEYKVKCAMCKKELCFTDGFHTVLDHWSSCLKLKSIEARLKTSGRSHGKGFVCDECGRLFQFKSGLLDHQDEHQGILKHECSKCDYKTGTASKLRAHQKYWHSSRARKFQKKTLVSCEICGAQVEQSYLSRHIANNHETPAWPCNECEKRFGTEITLKRHKNTVHSKAMVDCQVCGVQIKCAEKLKVHMAIHLPPKYFCRFCGKGLKSTVSLGNHERKVHTGENPYRCETCSFACASSGELLLHKKRHHYVPKVHFYNYSKKASSK